MSAHGPLAGRVALVTGAARGIGSGIARALAEAGAAVCVSDLEARRAEGEGVVRQLVDLGAEASFAAADVADRAEVEAMLEACERTLGAVDIVVSNAVASRRHTLLETPFEELVRAVEVGVYGTFHVLQAAARRMVRAGRDGSIVHVTSPWARIPHRGGVDYGVAKAGAHMLALMAASELAWHGVRVNLVEPGWVDTPGERAWLDDDALVQAGRELPLGRLLTPADVGRAVVFLASEPCMVGTVLRVDGGYSLRAGGRHDDPRRRPEWPVSGPTAP